VILVVLQIVSTSVDVTALAVALADFLRPIRMSSITIDHKLVETTPEGLQRELETRVKIQGDTPLSVELGKDGTTRIVSADADE
jgi:hypothetical protein